MNTIWAPWRIEYILGPKEDGCIFCTKPQEGDDRKNLILFRGEYHYIIMNAFPYNNGHLMVVPYRHTSSLRDWSGQERQEFMELTNLGVDLLSHVMSPHGFNLGVNMGETAGAGIASHLHLHIVPRWNGDTNFMPVLADTRVIPEHLLATYDKLRDALSEVRRS